MITCHSSFPFPNRKTSQLFRHNSQSDASGLSGYCRADNAFQTISLKEKIQRNTERFVTWVGTSSKTLSSPVLWFYLVALSQLEVLKLVDSHLSITVPYQDAVCLCGKQQRCHLHTRSSRLHNNGVQAERETWHKRTRETDERDKEDVAKYKSLVP